MGTRCITRVINNKGDHLINLYRQFDGYPLGHGKDLFNFLDGFKIVNGYDGSEGEKGANGAGCLAAQLVAHFKLRHNEEYPDKAIGGFYIYPVTAEDCGQEYEYVVTVTEVDWNSNEKFGSLSVKVISYKGEIFDGPLAAFGAFCDAPDKTRNKMPQPGAWHIHG